jgi:hypothetical protein
MATAAIIGTSYLLAAANAAAASASPEQIAGACDSGLQLCAGQRGRHPGQPGHTGNPPNGPAGAHGGAGGRGGTS